MSSLAYKLIRLIPGKEARLNFLLDLEWIANRLALETSSGLGLVRFKRNDFLLDRIRPTDRVLDLGCGPGYITGAIRAAKVVGIDYSEANLAIARRAYPEVEFVNAEARDYLARAERFDVLVLSHVLEHLDDPEEFLASLAPHFERLYIEVPDFDTTELNHIRATRGRQLVYCDDDHVSEFDREELVAMLAKVGFRQSGSEYIHGVMRFWFERS